MYELWELILSKQMLEIRKAEKPCKQTKESVDAENPHMIVEYFQLLIEEWLDWSFLRQRENKHSSKKFTLHDS